MFQLLLILIVLAILIFHVSTRYNRRGRISNKIAGLSPLPIFGNLLTFNVSQDKFWNLGKKMNNEFYPITKFWLFTMPVISVRHPDDLEVILTSSKVIQKGYWYDYMQPWLKTGLLTSTGDKWRHRRKILTPAFHFTVLKKYNEISLKEANKLVDHLKSEGKESIQNLIAFCSKYTLNIMCEAAMGVSFDKVDPQEAKEYKSAIHRWGSFVFYRVIHPHVPDWMIPFIPGLKVKQTLKILHGFTRKIIDERREFHKSTNYKYLDEINEEMKGKIYEEDITGRKKKLAMLDLLLVSERNGQIDSAGIQEEVDTFLFEGHDTSGMAMTFIILLLAENKEAQDRARAEVTELMDRNGGKLDRPDVQELNYLERCMKEALRLYPAVTTIQRYTEDDLQLKNALVPANTPMIINIYDAHRDPNFWPNPNKFDPDRFLTENTKDRHPFAYIPFSAGPRNCIGQKFAIMELKLLVSRILYNFYLEPIDTSSNVQIIADLVMRTSKDIRIKFTRIYK